MSVLQSLVKFLVVLVPVRLVLVPLKRSQIVVVWWLVFNCVVFYPVSGGKKKNDQKTVGKYLKSLTLSMHMYKCGNYLKTTIYEDTNLNLILHNSSFKPKKHQYLIYTDTYYPVNFREMKMHEAATHSLNIDNSGGASIYSEALSIHYMYERFGAANFLSEEELDYWIDYKKIDFKSTICEQEVGTQVSRAMGYPNASYFNKYSASNLMGKKMESLVIAKKSISEEHKFTRSILHIWCQTPKIAQLLTKAHRLIVDDDRSKGNELRDIIVILTICDKKYLYTDSMDE